MQDNTEEIWKDVVGYESMYKISNKGRVMSVTRKCGNKTVYGMILKGNVDQRGYFYATLYKKQKNKKIKIHKLVAIHFIDNPFNKPQINHIDGDKGNNCVLNLEWVTGSENIRHADKMGLRCMWKRRRIEKSEYELLISGKLSITELSKKYSVSKTTIKKYKKYARLELSTMLE